MPRRLAKLLAATAFGVLALCVPALAAPHFDGTFETPEFDGSNAKIAPGPDGNMWMPVSEGELDVIRIAPDGVVTPFKLGPEIEDPVGIAAGPDGRIWITATNKIGSFMPADPEGTFEVDNVASITSNSPLVAGPDGQMWAAASDNIVHWDPAAPEKAEAIAVAGLQPKDIDVAGSLLVVADFAPRIVTMSTSGVEVDYTIGNFDEGLNEQQGSSQGVAGAPSGQIAYSQAGSAPEQVGLITPPNPAQAFERDGDPFGVTLGSDQAFWVALAVAGGLQRLLPDGTSTFVPGLPEKYFARQIGAGPNNTLWVTLQPESGTDPYQVARYSGLEPPVEPISGNDGFPNTKIKKGPKGKVKTRKAKAKVKFSFSSGAKGAKFECALTKKKKGKKKAPKPKFKPCKSPKTYKLKPAAYKFAVRAVAGGRADPSPATRSFKVIRARG
jgi:virginiamycin B lyase